MVTHQSTNSSQCCLTLVVYVQPICSTTYVASNHYDFTLLRTRTDDFEGIKDGIQQMLSFYFNMSSFPDAVNNEFSFPMELITNNFAF